MPLDTATVITEALPALNAASTSDLYFWTTDELYQWMDDAVKHLAHTAQVFVYTPSTFGASPTIALQAGYVAAIRVYWNGAPLRESTVTELEALDDNWTATAGTPARWTQGIGLGSIRLYPAPTVAGTCLLILQSAPSDLSAGASTVATEVPAPFAGFLLQALIGKAREKVSDAQMPEIAAHCRERVALYEQVFANYWGATS